MCSFFFTEAAHKDCTRFVQVCLVTEIYMFFFAAPVLLLLLLRRPYTEPINFGCD